MAYTAQKLITEAWYLSNIVSRKLEVVTGAEINDGLDRLNAVIEIATDNYGLIPYWSSYQFDSVVGQEEYDIPGVVGIDTATYVIPDVRYQLIYKTREEYFGYPRVNQIESLPTIYHYETNLSGAKFYMYFLPSDVWEFTIWGKFKLTQVELNQDLSLTLPMFYIEYLVYKLAAYLCEYYDTPFSPEKMKRLASYEQSLRNASPIDFTRLKWSSFNSLVSPDYGMANLGHGWRVP